MRATPQKHPFGDLLRAWRQRRHLSQLELAGEASISTRHLSYVETGRSRPSRTLVLHLARHLQVPLREQNQLLLAAGYAPRFSERPLTDPALRAAREATERILRGHEPYPALALDRAWNIVAMNRAVSPLLTGVAPHLLTSPVNVLRLSLHPQGLAPHILNLSVWREHLLSRVQHQTDLTGDSRLEELLEEVSGYAVRAPNDGGVEPDTLVTPLRLKTPQAVLSFISTTTVFGTPLEVTLSELALETFFPADAETAAWLHSSSPSHLPLPG